MAQRLHPSACTVLLTRHGLPQDPRWGRADESPSEDPLTVGAYGTQYARGLQREGDSPYLQRLPPVLRRSVSSTGARPHTQRVFTGGRERDGRPNDQPAAGVGYEALVPRRAASCSS